jgi:hypothetical protein
MEQLDELSRGVTETLFEQWMKQKYLVEDLAKAPEIKLYSEAQAKVGELESQFKQAMKDEDIAELKAGKWEVTMKSRTTKPTVDYKIDVIEKEPWAAGCIIKAVNGTVFDAILKGMGLKPDAYVTVTAGTTTKAVTIKELPEGYEFFSKPTTKKETA